MHLKLQNLRLLDRRQILAVVAVGLFLCAMLVGLLGNQKAQAATSSTLNFQARLMNGDGSIVPDGKYSIEFKLYNTAATGAAAQGACDDACIWVETRTGINAVTVVNGYVTVNLGSVNPFGNNINWDQELWLTMNVGGTTGVPKWDGEMSPRLKLTAVPYAFQAGQLTQQGEGSRSTLGFDKQTASNNILLPDESGILCIQGSDNCGFLKGGLQGVYDSSFSPEIVINQSKGAVIIRSDAEGLVHELLKIQSNDGSKTYLGVDTSGVSVGGTLTVSTLGAADTATFLCYNSAGQIATCTMPGAGSVVGASGSESGPGSTPPSGSTDSQSTGSESLSSAQDNTYLGSMYYDVATGNIQCYEAGGWGACAAAPDNIVNLNPEYAGAILNGDGVGAMSTDFCSNGADLAVNVALCAPGQARNFYKWTSPEVLSQTRSIYVTYQLPANFKGFASDDTVQLTARVDNSADASVTYEMYKSTGTDVVQCATGTGATDVIAGGGGTADTWHTYGISGNEATGCGFDSSSAGNTIIFKINLTASNGASAYVSTLSFVTTTR